MSFYPVYLTRLNQKPVVLLGGGSEAERKTRELLSFDLKLVVICQTISKNMLKWYNSGRFEWKVRNYRYGDLRDAGFVIAAECPYDIAKQASEEANERNLIINVMDNLELSNSAFGSLLQQGRLTVSFSTNGIAPALAVRLKERFQNELDEAYGSFLELAGQLRPYIVRYWDDPEVRRNKWYEWVDSEVITCLRQSNRNKALELTEEIWGKKVLIQAGLLKNRDFISRLLVGMRSIFS